MAIYPIRIPPVIPTVKEVSPNRPATVHTSERSNGGSGSSGGPNGQGEPQSGSGTPSPNGNGNSPPGQGGSSDDPNSEPANPNGTGPESTSSQPQNQIERGNGLNSTPTEPQAGQRDRPEPTSEPEPENGGMVDDPNMSFRERFNRILFDAAKDSLGGDDPDDENSNFLSFQLDREERSRTNEGHRISSQFRSQLSTRPKPRSPTLQSWPIWSQII